MGLTITFDHVSTALFGVVLVGTLITGSTFEWVWQHGGPLKNQYNMIVTIAALTSFMQTVCCYVNALMYPNPDTAFVIYILVNWFFMTHSSVLVVSRKLSFTFPNAEVMFKKFLWINVCLLPFSAMTFTTWGMHHATHSDLWARVNSITEPIEIFIWAAVEFCLSGYFIVQMWKFQWTEMERKGIYVLVLVGLCDCFTFFISLFLGDLQATCVKGFVYCLRIRLEIQVLDAMVDFVKSRRDRVSYGADNSTTVDSKRRLSGRFKSTRSSSKFSTQGGNDKKLKGNSSIADNSVNVSSAFQINDDNNKSSKATTTPTVPSSLHSPQPGSCTYPQDQPAYFHIPVEQQSENIYSHDNDDDDVELQRREDTISSSSTCEGVPDDEAVGATATF